MHTYCSASAKYFSFRKTRCFGLKLVPLRLSAHISSHTEKFHVYTLVTQKLRQGRVPLCERILATFLLLESKASVTKQWQWQWFICSNELNYNIAMTAITPWPISELYCSSSVFSADVAAPVSPLIARCLLWNSEIRRFKGKGKDRILIKRYLHSKSLWPAALYNLGSGSWLARATEPVVLQRKLRPSIAHVNGQLEPRHAASKHTTAPINNTRPSPRKHSPDGVRGKQTSDYSVLLIYRPINDERLRKVNRRMTEFQSRNRAANGDTGAAVCKRWLFAASQEARVHRWGPLL